jgi:iron complex transport system substrate-binding protein
VRVVSLTCSNTEIVCALGCARMLVGIDNHSDYPASVIANLPRVGPDLQIDIDAVAALNPDLVLASLTVPGHERIVQGLERAKLPFLAPEPIAIADVYSDIRTIGRHLGVPGRAETLVSAMQREFAESKPTDGPRPRVLVEWWPKPVIAPGQRSWVTELLTLAGAVNPLAELPVKSQPLTDEQAARLGPDVAVISWCGVKVDKYRPHVVYRRPAWQNTEAVRNRHVFPVSEAYLGRPGPRLLEGYRALRRIVEQVTRERSARLS